MADYKAYWREYHRKRYERLKAEGRCPKCGKPVKDSTYKYCRECRMKAGGFYHERKEHEGNG